MPRSAAPAVLRSAVQRVHAEVADRRLRRLERRARTLREHLRRKPARSWAKTDFKRARSRRAGAYGTLEDAMRATSSRELLALLVEAGLTARTAPELTAAPAGGRILVLIPHHDDDGVGAAGTLLQAAERGATLRLAYLTDGATSLGMVHPDAVVRLRAEEARRAWRPTGAQLDFVGMPSGIPELPGFAVDRLVALLDEVDPTHVFVPTFLEEPYEHRLLSHWLLRAVERRPLDAAVEIWGYQVTTRLPGTAVVDVSDVADAKFRLNEAWTSQNALLDYAHLAAGQDGGNITYLPTVGDATAAEVFVRLPAAAYLDLARRVLDLEARTEAALDDAAAAPAGEVPPPDFLVVGLQKCGTYWLTALLDAHPDIRCFPSRPGRADGTGEAHLFDQLALMDTDYPHAARSLAGKLDGTFADLLTDTAPADPFAHGILARALADRFSAFCDEQRRTHHARLVGEKTTETVHHPDLVDQLFPHIKKIAILRDPRDRVVSFHFHEQRKNRRTDERIDRSFVAAYAQRITRDLQGLLALTAPVHVLTYEQLHTDPAHTLTALLGFLDAPADPDTITRLLDHATFERLAGRPTGDNDPDSHFRSGTTGTWTDHLAADHAAWLTDHLDHLHARVEQAYDLDLSAYRTAAQQA